jgi:hypothetical protein
MPSILQNEQIRRSASRDRDMREEEGLVLKVVPREPSEEPPANNTAEVAKGVEMLEIASSIGGKKRKSEDETKQPHSTSKVYICVHLEALTAMTHIITCQIFL